MLLVVENEVDPDRRYFGRALRRHLPDHRVHDLAREGGLPSFDGVDGVVLGGSTAGVYETADHPWMDDGRRLVRHLIEGRVPTLGVCFGHQLVNDALGGRVERRGMTAELRAVDLAADPLFEGVSDVVPLVHQDQVVEPGEGMEPIAAADYYPYVATRHREAPVWTVQYHPEFTAALQDRAADHFGFTTGEHSFEDVTAMRTLANFADLAAADARDTRPDDAADRR